MFKRSAETGGAVVRLRIDGRDVNASAGDSVAAALLLAGLGHCRTTPASGAPRSPYCMMGVCFDCLVSIDGVGNQQACMVPVREDMVVERQQGKREVGR
jgi:D-hydroxyproline dehydrogenase subunit gamma